MVEYEIKDFNKKNNKFLILIMYVLNNICLIIPINLLSFD